MKNYIKINIKTMLVAVIALALTGCIKDGLVECPEGNIRINLYVEQFQNPSQDPLANTERIFSDRIQQMRYYLYRDGQLVENKTINVASSSDKYYPFTFDEAEYGNYQLVVVANSTKNALNGDPVNANNLVLRFMGCTDTEDYFTTVFPFMVNSNEPVEYNVGLLRTHGVVRYHFVNMPEDITHVDIDIENVSSEKWITGDYAMLLNANQRYNFIPVVQQARFRTTNEEENYLMGTFPTLTDQRALYYLSLYREGDTKAYHKALISDTLNIRRNQLVEVIATFNSHQDIDFEINLDTRWDDISHGGSTEIQ